jgi:hypothetical protein
MRVSPRMMFSNWKARVEAVVAAEDAVPALAYRGLGPSSVQLAASRHLQA